jgi:putative pyruvate formate lyase activating enzyme
MLRGNLDIVMEPIRERREARFVLEPFEPGYVALEASGELDRRAEAAIHGLEHCCFCPRECGTDRLADHTGVCKTGRHARVSSALAHRGEESCLSGLRGSGTIFFGHCNLQCVFCQNWDLSQRPAGEELPAERIADLMLHLEERGCHNINLVTPEHLVPQVIESITDAVHRGLTLPIVYNTSAYDSVDSLRLLDGIVDVYMPDFKFWRAETAARLCKAKDYPDRARAALREMHRQVGVLKTGPDGIARRGVLVRHLVLPGHLDESREIFRWLAAEISPDTYVNIMAQYRPEFLVGREDLLPDARFEEIDRRPTGEEITRAHAEAREAGLWRFDR